MIKTVNVFLNHIDNKLFVGKLALKNRKIYFEYDESFIIKVLIDNILAIITKIYILGLIC